MELGHLAAEHFAERPEPPLQSLQRLPPLNGSVTFLIRYKMKVFVEAQLKHDHSEILNAT